MIDRTTITELLWQHYHLEGSLLDLPGDVDNNFKVQTSGRERYVLKLMHPQSSEAALDFQCAALTHLADCPLLLPRVVQNRQDRPWCRVETEQGEQFLWMLNYCPGTLLADHKLRDRALHRSFGAALGMLDRCLQDFSHPAMFLGSRWQLSRAAQMAPALHAVDDRFQSRISTIFECFSTRIAPALAMLPHGVLHNDANDYNVLVNDQGRVSGLFDFGDMAWQPRICESAIALAYLMMDQPEPTDVLQDFLLGYTGELPLQTGELELLWPLIETRLAVSVVISSERQRSEPDNKYLVISQAPAKRLLDRMSKVPPALVASALGAGA